jgi:small conductance mechanosensitive channel
LTLQISYGSDIDCALAVMTRVGEQMQDDPAFADMIVEPIEVVGVDGLGDSGVTLKARIKTQPMQQWSVGREYNRRIKLAFDAAGVEIPFPHMKVVLPDNQLSELVGH